MATRDLLPGTDARQQCVDDHEPGHAFRILRRQRLADHVADVVRHHLHPVDLQIVKDARDVVRLRFLVVPTPWAAPTAHPAKVPNITEEQGASPTATAPTCRPTRRSLEKNDRRPETAHTNVKGRAVGGDLLHPKRRGKRFDSGKSGGNHGDPRKLCRSTNAG